MSRRLFTLALLALSPLLPLESSAVTPLTPRLDDPTRFALLARLAATGMPEVGQNSVVLAIAAALGFEAADGRHDAPSAYAHLPSVTAVATKVSDRCVAVEALADGAKEKGYRPRVVTGTYCLVGPAAWSSQDQQVAAP